MLINSKEFISKLKPFTNNPLFKIFQFPTLQLIDRNTLNDTVLEMYCSHLAIILKGDFFQI